MIVTIGLWAILWLSLTTYFPHHRPLISFLCIFCTTTLGLLSVAFKKPEITGLNGSFNLLFLLILLFFFFVYLFTFFRLDQLFKDKDLLIKFQDYIFKLDTKEKEADQILKEMKRLASETTELSNLMSLTINSLGDDKRAISKVRDLSNDPSFKYQEQAKKLYDTVTSSFLYQDYGGDWKEILGTDVPPASYSLEQFRELFEKKNLKTDYKIQIIQYLARRRDFNLKDRQKFYFKIIQTENSQKAITYACYHLGRKEEYEEEPRIKIDEEEITKTNFDDWWAKNSDKFK